MRQLQAQQGGGTNITEEKNDDHTQYKNTIKNKRFSFIIEYIFDEQNNYVIPKEIRRKFKAIQRRKLKYPKQSQYITVGDLEELFASNQGEKFQKQWTEYLLSTKLKNHLLGSQRRHPYLQALPYLIQQTANQEIDIKQEIEIINLSIQERQKKQKKKRNLSEIRPISEKDSIVQQQPDQHTKNQNDQHSDLNSNVRSMDIPNSINLNAPSQALFQQDNDLIDFEPNSNQFRVYDQQFSKLVKQFILESNCNDNFDEQEKNFIFKFGQFMEYQLDKRYVT